MTEGEFPFRSFTMRSEGYDRTEVDSYVDEMQREITELRRAIETATHSGDSASDSRLHDPEGAVMRTLAIAQETADRVLHDAQVEADRRRAEADEHARSVIAQADDRANRLLGEMEAQAAEVREQGIAAARSAIQVERDNAMAELAHVRRVRDDLRNEALHVKAALDKYRSQAREASDTLAAVSSGPLMSIDLPDFVDDDVALARISARTETMVDDLPDINASADKGGDPKHSGSHLHSVGGTRDTKPHLAADQPHRRDKHGLADVISIDGDHDDGDQDDGDDDESYVDETDVDESYVDESYVDESYVDADDDESDDLDVRVDPPAERGFGGTFLAEVRAAAQDDVALAPEDDESDRFLSELRGIAAQADQDLDSDAAETFFEDD